MESVPQRAPPANILVMRAHGIPALVAGMVALLVNPAMSCSSSNSVHYEYGASEMANGAAGPWQVTLQQATGSVTGTFGLEPGSGPGATGQMVPVQRMQCGTREFIADAGACMDVSTLYLTGAFTAGDATLMTLPITGTYSVYSTQYVGGTIELKLGDQIRLSFDLDANDAVKAAYASDASGALVATVVRAP